MANVLNVNKLVDGEHNGVAHVEITYNDTTDGEVVVLDSSALTGGTAIKAIEEIEAHAIGCSAVIEFKQDSNSRIAAIPEGESHIKFMGNRIQNPEGTGTTGDVVCITSGLSVAGDTLIMTIKYRK